MSGEITLPKFATSAANEEEPSEAKKNSGWTDGEEPAAEYLNWIHRRTYESAKANLALAQAQVAGKHAELAVGHGAAVPIVSYEIQVPLWDDDVIVLGCYAEGTDVQITTSEDGGLSFTDRYGPTTGSLPEVGIVSPGRYAVMVVDASTWLHAPYPYTSWALVSSSTFSSTTRNNMGLLPIDGIMSAVLTGTSSTTSAWIEYTPADTEPTAAGDWTSLNLTGTATFQINGMAYNDDYLAVAILENGEARVRYAATGSGGLSGHWTSQVIDAGVAGCVDIAWTGSQWVALCAGGTVYVSADLVTWNQAGSVASGHLHLTCDQDTGFLYAYWTSSNGIHVSRDHGVTWSEAIAAGSNDMTAHGTKLGYDKKRRYLFGGNNSQTYETFLRTL